MTLDLSANSHKLTAESPGGEEFTVCAHWLNAGDITSKSLSGIFSVSPLASSGI